MAGPVVGSDLPRHCGGVRGRCGVAVAPLVPWRRAWERRVFWGATGAAALCGFLAGLPDGKRGIATGLVIAGGMALVAYVYTPNIKIGGKIYAWHADDRVPDPSPEDTAASGKPRIRIRVVIALLSAGAAVRFAFLLGDILGPPPRSVPVPVPPVLAVGPGVGLAVDFADGSGGESCTVGFLVRTSTGQTGLLTAGHCNGPGGPSTAAINYAGSGGDQTVGTFTETAYGDGAGEPHDIALVVLDGLGDIPVNSDVAGHPVVGVSSDPIGELCHVGFPVNHEQCGSIVARTATRIGFAAPNTCGDSGGPVYSVDPGGTARAVGILIGSIGDPDGTESPTGPCGPSGRIAAVELIQPWLDQWHLTLVTALPR